ncbi:hypothetical protein UL82_05330 [Corynebacterium kutscheri]|uniref:DNA-binding protein n=1 Tax=Corynebacterium kutscheri TaxID=35755 RepID=A0A0F6TCX6_9CORY|nr:helix-turn-helix domain-containing protein [Corynebacterium kutscheri]AKE41241.1 hypothetical protein UL82_05330 [Corynebacterium kutscheri]VEH09563.1 putative DNA-binding protein [Corynebacterium kutscheri]
MFAVQARYRGRERRRAELVANSAQALATLEGVNPFRIIGVEDIVGCIDTAQATVDVVMALLAYGDWAIAIGVSNDDEAGIMSLLKTVMGKHTRAGVVKVGVKRGKRKDKAWAEDIQASFILLGHVLMKRTAEGKEATSLVRSGLNQNEAAEELGISKQAMSQRLQAAGWQAEVAGYKQAVSLLNRAETEMTC